MHWPLVGISPAVPSALRSSSEEDVINTEKVKLVGYQEVPENFQLHNVDMVKAESYQALSALLCIPSPYAPQCICSCLSAVSYIPPCLRQATLT